MFTDTLEVPQAWLARSGWFPVKEAKGGNQWVDEDTGQLYCLCRAGGSGRLNYSWDEVYELLPREDFAGRPRRYSEQDHEKARNHPLGFYHGMRVLHGQREMVLVGPSRICVPAGVAVRWCNNCDHW